MKRLCLTTILFISGILAPAFSQRLAPPANPRQALTSLPACQLVSQEEMEKLLGVKLLEPAGAVYVGETAKQWPNTARLSTCQYRQLASGAPVEVDLSVFTLTAPNPNAVLDIHHMIETQTRDDHRDVTGVGDAAVWEARGKYWSQDPSMRVGSLWVVLGGRTEIDLSVSGTPSEAEALELARKVALRLIGPAAGPAFTYNSKPALPALKKPVLAALPARPTSAETLLHDLTARADAGLRPAQLHLGLLYEYAIGDSAAAAYWYRQAADKGDPSSAYCLALLYRDGKGVPKNEAAAIALFAQSAENGYVPAMRDLVSLYMQRGSWSGVGRASEWLSKAVAAGDTGSMVMLGYMFQKGIGTIVNDVLALRNYRKAADLGNCTAMMNIGGIYFNGSTVSHIPQDAAQAKAWFAKAEACDASDAAGVRAKAAEFRQKAARGELPDFGEVRKAGPAGQPGQPGHGQAGRPRPGGMADLERTVMAGYATGGALGALFALGRAIPDNGDMGDISDNVQRQDHELRQIMQRRDMANQEWFNTMARSGGQVVPH